MIIPSTPSELLLFSTIRIEIETKKGSKGIGTGFFFDHRLENGQQIPLIITNKHVIKDAVRGVFCLHEALERDGKMVPSDTSFPVHYEGFESAWIMHSDDQVDLCAIPFLPIKAQAEKIGKKVYSASLGNNLIFSDGDLTNLSAVEDVVMVGYPIGLWDDKNNLPIFRRGITATHPAIDFNGKSEGLIDIAAFPGSSGSPVMLLNENGIYHDKKSNSSVVGQRIVFLGVLRAIPQMNIEGEIIIKDIPVVQIPYSKTPIMINLGYYVKAKEVLKLGEQINAILKQ